MRFLRILRALLNDGLTKNFDQNGSFNQEGGYIRGDLVHATFVQYNSPDDTLPYYDQRYQRYCDQPETNI